MNGSIIIIIFASIGFIIMGLVMLRSKKLKDILIASNIYKDTEKYINFNGKVNLVVGYIGLAAASIDYLWSEESSYIVIIFIAIMLSATIIQKVVGKKYKN